ncbi:MAG TPA: ChaN family lipoprotein, partial [Gemmataceae bacterium]|nr:ChaN family lipoprotein [Gemmataceae bacterium]
GYNWLLYRPIVEFCRNNGIPVAALNAPRELTQRISQVGFAKLKDEEKKQLGALDLHRKDHRDYWLERLAKMHGKSKVSAEQKERSYQVMAVWDDFMAASAARFQKEHNLRRLVVLAGSGHIERGFGIPLRTAERTGGRVLTVGIYPGKGPKRKADETLTDFTIVVE